MQFLFLRNRMALQGEEVRALRSNIFKHHHDGNCNFFIITQHRDNQTRHATQEVEQGQRDH